MALMMKKSKIAVKVRVEVLGNTTMNGRSRPGQTRGAAFDDEDDTLIAGSGTRGTVMAPQQQRPKTTQGVPVPASATPVPAYNSTKYNEYRAKYGRPGGNSNATSAGWTVAGNASTAHMAATRNNAVRCLHGREPLLYRDSAIAGTGKVSPLPPSSWFIVVLICIVPAVTIGALLVNWSTKWSGRETLNRLCAGLSSVLAVVGIVEFVWQTMLQVNVPGLQLFVLLLFATVAAYFGITPKVSNRIVSSVSWGIRRRSLRQITIGGTLVIGGVLGFS